MASTQHTQHARTHGSSFNPERKSAVAHPNNKIEEPLSYYRKILKDTDPGIIAARTGLPYDEDAQAFTIRLVGRDVRITWPDGKVAYADTAQNVTPYAEILLLRILVEGNLAPASGAFLPYTDIGWGESYWKAFSGRCIGRLSHMFANAAEFAACAEALGAVRVEEGDAAYDFEFVDGVFMRLILWDADDEFPLSAQILFSDNTPVTFTSEDAAVMGDILLGELEAAKRSMA